ncbi:MULTISPECIES: hypothetical protein [unclassified Lacticaseibacillus]|uniref:hypothetical protein n=1 Tax=unclassified Lacticaseibacillus TaxID=2759744 RepID=UPI001945636E|nr:MULTISPECIES: hypothetical protein [unclassified Lacticaseibacillus]
MKKWLIMAAAALVLLLAGCQKRQADYAEVYNAAGQRVTTIKKAAGVKKTVGHHRPPRLRQKGQTACRGEGRVPLCAASGEN